MAWGPVIYANDTVGNNCVVDNLLVLFQNNSQEINHAPKYVLATSGTNDISKFGWFDEDFDAYSMIHWPDNQTAGNIHTFCKRLTEVKPSGEASGIAVSLGTATGISELLGMTYQGDSIHHALKKLLNGSHDTIAVAGHSLGGALSPSLALVLKQYQHSWDTDQNVVIEAYPTAGASPGNQGFHDYFFDSFQNNFHGRMNMMDMVPHAWQKNMLNDIKTLYEADNDTSWVIKEVINKVECRLRKLNPSFPYQSLYTDTIDGPPISERSFDFPYDTSLIRKTYVDSIMSCCKMENFDCPAKAQFYIDLIRFMAKLSPPKDLCSETVGTLKFLAQAGYQHTTAYNEYYSADFMSKAMKASKKARNLDSTDTKTTMKSLEKGLEDYFGKYLILCLGAEE